MIIETMTWLSQQCLEIVKVLRFVVSKCAMLVTHGLCVSNCRLSSHKLTVNHIDKGLQPVEFVCTISTSAGSNGISLARDCLCILDKQMRR